MIVPFVHAFHANQKNSVFLFVYLNFATLLMRFLQFYLFVIDFFLFLTGVMKIIQIFERDGILVLDSPVSSRTESLHYEVKANAFQLWFSFCYQ